MKFNIIIEALPNQPPEMGLQLLACVLPKAVKIERRSQTASNIEQNGAG